MNTHSVIEPSNKRRLRFAWLIAVISLFGVVAVPTNLEAAPRRITLPVAADHVDNVRWSDTWGAARSGGRSHIGVDILGPKMTPVVAVRDATITWSRFSNSRGSIIRLRDTDGWEYQYIHMNNDTPGTDDGKASCQQTFSTRLCSTLTNGSLQRGLQVSEGEVIGYFGDAGNAESTTPHLHFEIYQPTSGGVAAVNPTPFVDAALEAYRTGQAPPETATAIGHWPSAEAAANDTFFVIHGRQPSKSEEAAFASSAKTVGVWKTITGHYNDAAPGAELTRIYAALFDRQPDIAGYEHWLEKHQQGASVSEISTQFASSQEYANRYSSTSTSRYIETLYENALGRQSDSAGKAHWLAKINRRSLSTRDLAYEFVRAREAQNLYRDQTELTTLSVLRSGTIPSQAEIDRWAAVRDKRDLEYTTTAWYGD